MKAGKMFGTGEPVTKGETAAVLETVWTTKRSQVVEMVRGEPGKTMDAVAGEMRRDRIGKLAERAAGVMERGLAWEMKMGVTGKVPTGVP